LLCSSPGPFCLARTCVHAFSRNSISRRVNDIALRCGVFAPDHQLKSRQDPVTCQPGSQAQEGSTRATPSRTVLSAEEKTGIYWRAQPERKVPGPYAVAGNDAANSREIEGTRRQKPRRSQKGRGQAEATTATLRIHREQATQRDTSADSSAIISKPYRDDSRGASIHVAP
jgi:hypothetical protein